MQTIGVTLLSGGLDSTTVTTYAKDRVQSLTALTFHYGQTHNKEVECAREIAQRLGLRHQLVDISGFGKVAWYSSLTNPERFPLPKDRDLQRLGPPFEGDKPALSIPITYVPLRNTFFLTVAGALLESLALYYIEEGNVAPEQVEALIFMAPNAIDYSGYPDCRPEYYEKVADALMYGSKLWTQYRVPFKIETPIIHMSKAEIAMMGMRLEAPLESTWSCYQAGEFPCGHCDSCVLRAKGFAEAGRPDPLLVRLEGTTP